MTASIQIRIDFGGSDSIPHTFVSVTHPDGSVIEYGLVPAVSMSAASLGKIDVTGTGAGKDKHEYDVAGPTIPLSVADYTKLMDAIAESIENPPDYILPGTWWPGGGTNCTGWVIDLWNRVELPATIGSSSWFWNPYGQGIGIVVNNMFREAITPNARDPLAIDLENDGIETIGIPTTGNPILFDHDANGVKTGTGWLKGDDAWLVLDRDGNGNIDSGRELFGVDTLITVTETLSGANGVPYNSTYTRNATSGFEALSTLDANGDKVFNTQDAAFSQVRLWRDLNQNGISDAGELLSLAQANVTGISLNVNNTNTDLGNGNSVTGAAVVTRSTGGNTLAETVNLSASNLNLGNNPFYRQFTDRIPLTEQARMLPDMGGSGALRDLREAMSLGTVQAQSLTAAVASFAQGSTRTEQRNRLSSVLENWATTSGGSLTPWESGQVTVNWAVVSETPTTATIRYTSNSTRPFSPGPGSYASVGFVSDKWYEPAFIGRTLTSAARHTLRTVGVLERFNGAVFLDTTNTIAKGGGGGAGGSSGGSSSGSAWTELLRVRLTDQQAEALQASYEALFESAYAGLVVQTRLRPYLDEIALVIDSRGIQFNADALVAKLQSKYATNRVDAAGDLVDLIRYTGPTLQTAGFDATGLLQAWRQQAHGDAALTDVFNGLGVTMGASLVTTQMSDIFLGDAAANSVDGGGGHDFLSGGAGADTLDGGAGDDTLDGGGGNDALAGGAGNDTFLFGKGDGQDSLQPDSDTAANKLNLLQFKAGVLPTEVVAARSGADLLLSIAGTSDKVTVSRFFQGDDPANGDNPLQQVRFFDGTTWDVSSLKAVALKGTAADQTLTGYIEADTIDGLAGNDTVYGQAGNDAIRGGTGNDTLSGGTGDDVLHGDAKTSRVTVRARANLAGDVGAQMQIWGGGVLLATKEMRDLAFTDHVFDIALPAGPGARLDIVYSNDAAINGQDRNLYVESVVVEGSRLKPTDAGVVLDRGVGAGAFDGLDTLVSNGSMYWSSALRFTLPISVAGLGGNDLLSGDAGNDVLNGGTGTDTMDGGAGNDTFLFGKGDGQDTIDVDFDTTVGKFNTLQFKAGVLPSEVNLTRSGSDLVLSIAGTTDTVTARWFFYNDDPATSYNPINLVRFSDGSSWDIATLKAKAIAGSALAQTLTGYTGADTINALGGDDRIYGQAGDDMLDGGDGNDSLYGGIGNDNLLGGTGNDLLSGEPGNDVLNGGTGTDTMDGGAGNDTFLFGKGDGQDTIDVDFDTTAGKFNTLQFKAGVLPSEVNLTRSGSDLVLSIAGTTDTVTARWFFYNDDPATSYNPINLVRFSDGSSWNIATLKAKAIAGSALAQTLTGYTGADTINALGGDDRIYGQAGDDMLDGGDGNDSLYGGIGNDNLLGGTGNDLLSGEPGNDVLNGGTGTDTMDGGAGNDTFLFGKGDGQDTIDVDFDTTVGKFNTLQFKAGVLPSEVNLTRSGSDLVLSIAGTTDTVTARWFFYNDDPATSYNPINLVRFSDGSSWDIATLKAKAIAGSALAQTLTGYTGADTINALGGDDRIYGQAGDDMLDGGDGNDSLYGGIGNDNLLGGTGNDLLSGEPGNDVLNGGTGTDTMDGGAGNDTFLFGKGDGQDTIDVDFDTTAGKFNTLQFKAGVLPSEVNLTRSGSDLVLSIAGTTDTVTARWFFYNDDPATSYNPINLVRFSDGSSWNIATLRAKAIAGSASRQTVISDTGTASLVDERRHDNVSLQETSGPGKPRLGRSGTQMESRLDALVSAMATFAPAPGFQGMPTAGHQEPTNPLIAVNRW